MDYRFEAEFARDLTRAAGYLALDLQGKVAVSDKGRGEGLVTEADLEVEGVLLARLAEEFPHDAILSEETRPDVDPTAPRIWCVDPIDGTREYAQGRGEFAVQVGLLVGGEPVAGAVALPAARVVYWGWRGGGCFRDEVWAGGDRGGPVRVEKCADLASVTAVHTRSRMSQRLCDALDRIGVGDRVAAGGVGYKAAQLLGGRAQLYFHPERGLSWWDTAGPVAVLLAAGATVLNAEGGPLRYDAPIKHARGLFCAAPGVAPLVLERLGLG